MSLSDPDARVSAAEVSPKGKGKSMPTESQINPGGTLYQPEETLTRPVNLLSSTGVPGGGFGEDKDNSLPGRVDDDARNTRSAPSMNQRETTAALFGGGNPPKRVERSADQDDGLRRSNDSLARALATASVITTIILLLIAVGATCFVFLFLRAQDSARVEAELRDAYETRYLAPTIDTALYNPLLLSRTEAVKVDIEEDLYAEAVLADWSFIEETLDSYALELRATEASFALSADPHDQNGVAAASEEERLARAALHNWMRTRFWPSPALVAEGAHEQGKTTPAPEHDGMDLVVGYWPRSASDAGWSFWSQRLKNGERKLWLRLQSTTNVNELFGHLQQQTEFAQPAPKVVGTDAIVIDHANNNLGISMFFAKILATVGIKMRDGVEDGVFTFDSQRTVLSGEEREKMYGKQGSCCDDSDPETALKNGVLREDLGVALSAIVRYMKQHAIIMFDNVVVSGKGYGGSLSQVVTMLREWSHSYPGLMEENLGRAAGVQGDGVRWIREFFAALTTLDAVWGKSGVTTYRSYGWAPAPPLVLLQDFGSSGGSAADHGSVVDVSTAHRLQDAAMTNTSMPFMRFTFPEYRAMFVGDDIVPRLGCQTPLFHVEPREAFFLAGSRAEAARNGLEEALETSDVLNEYRAGKRDPSSMRGSDKSAAAGGGTTMTARQLPHSGLLHSGMLADGRPLFRLGGTTFRRLTGNGDRGNCDSAERLGDAQFAQRMQHTHDNEDAHLFYKLLQLKEDANRGDGMLLAPSIGGGTREGHAWSAASTAASFVEKRTGSEGVGDSSVNGLNKAEKLTQGDELAEQVAQAQAALPQQPLGRGVLPPPLIAPSGLPSPEKSGVRHDHSQSQVHQQAATQQAVPPHQLRVDDSQAQMRQGATSLQAVPQHQVPPSNPPGRSSGWPPNPRQPLNDPSRITYSGVTREDVTRCLFFEKAAFDDSGDPEIDDLHQQLRAMRKMRSSVSWTVLLLWLLPIFCGVMLAFNVGELCFSPTAPGSKRTAAAHQKMNEFGRESAAKQSLRASVASAVWNASSSSEEEVIVVRGRSRNRSGGASTGTTPAGPGEAVPVTTGTVVEN